MSFDTVRMASCFAPTNSRNSARVLAVNGGRKLLENHHINKHCFVEINENKFGFSGVNNRKCGPLQVKSTGLPNSHSVGPIIIIAKTLFRIFIPRFLCLEVKEVVD
jgi:hypothetical protein